MNNLSNLVFVRKCFTRVCRIFPGAIITIKELEVKNSFGNFVIQFKKTKNELYSGKKFYVPE